MGCNDDKTVDELNKDFDLLLTNPSSAVNLERMKRDSKEWKLKDPVGYKKDMENMCKEMLGDAWLPEYEALLREEFPEEFEESD
jgi:hypothetical protein